MSTRRILLGVVVVVMFGCSEKREPALQAEQSAAVAERSPAIKEPVKPVDPFYVLERIRQATATLGPGWSVAQSPLTWSTLTLDFGLPFPNDAAAIVWAKWTEPKTALTIEANQKIKSEIEQAIAASIQKKGHIERTFDSTGFQFAVTASAVPDKDMSFVRISFKCLEY